MSIAISGLLTIQQVKVLTTLSKNTIYRLIRKGKFPAPIKIGIQRVAWREDEVAAVIAGASASRNGGKA